MKSMTPVRTEAAASLVAAFVTVTFLPACAHQDDLSERSSHTKRAPVVVTKDEIEPYLPFPTIRFTMLGSRPVGPLAPQEAESYIQRLRDVRYSALYVPRHYQELRLVMTASVKKLSEYLLSHDEVLADEAAFEAALRADKRLLPPLVESLNRIVVVISKEMKAPPHGLYSRRTTIVSAIGRIGTSEALDVLRQLVEHQDIYVRLTAAYLLAQRGEKHGMSTLREGVFLTPQLDRRVRRRFAEALLNIGFGTTKSELDELFDSLDGEARYLSPILAKRGDKLSLAYLREQSVNRNRYHGVRKWAAMALGQARDRAAIPYLLRALGDNTREVREEAEQALRLIEGSPSSDGRPEHG
ncbi:HEAT repeat domain-containing protein [Fimbriimonadia bacterium ATM]|nr:HEAT repeat domain-containing protein [Fimbriimonadia bacterium ATM]